VTTARVAAREAGAARALAAVDRVVAPTRSLAAAFAGRLSPAATVLPYAFDVAPYAAVERVRDPAHARFAFMGQLAPHKGPDVALHAFAIVRDRLAARGVHAQLQLFGAAPSGRFESYARALIERLPEGAMIEPAFEPGDAPVVLAHVDAVVVPSLWDENAPLVCLEARAAGVPVAGSRVPGIAEVVAEGLHGHLSDPGDVEGLAVALASVLDLPPVPRDLPVDLDAHADQVLALYRAP
jgi:glycosyltransferase involved in cell wall biosynthesis